MSTFDLSIIKAAILDMDGVLWEGSRPIGDLPVIFSHMANRGWKVIMATNNATRTAQQNLGRLAGFGVDGLEAWQVITSAHVAALYLKERHPQGGPVYIVGEEGLQEALCEQGFFPAEQDVAAVVAGIDRQISYEKLRRATLLIRAGAPFIGTNPDRTFPTPEGLAPGAGSILAALEAATSVAPTIMGKPSPAMYLAALKRLGVQPGETLVVGDRLETDIEGAQAIGCRTALVLSGVTTEAAARAWKPAPDIIAKDLASVVG
jgi:4-nitrophenyl phosphatase